MDAIRSIGISICITAVLTALFMMLSPDSKLERTLKFAISLFFLAGLVSPFLDGEIKLDLKLDTMTRQTADTRIARAAAEQFSTLAQTRLEATLESLLRAEGIEVKKVRLQTTITPEGGISISRLEVYLSAGGMGQQKAAESLLLRETGILPEVWEI